MEEKDFQRIEQLIGKVVKAEVGEAVKTEIKNISKEIGSVRSDVGSLKEEMKGVQAQVGSVTEGVKIELGIFKAENDAKFDLFRKEIRKELNEDFRHHVGILAEDFSHKLQLVAEGHQMLSEKLDRVEENLENKIDSLSADVAAHRADTEGHKRGYVVSEP